MDFGSQASELHHLIQDENRYNDRTHPYVLNDDQTIEAKTLVSEEEAATLRSIVGHYLKNDTNANESLTKKVLTEFHQKIPSFDESVVLTDIIYLFKERGSNHTAEILKGAHVLIGDGGAYYDRWNQLSSARERISSHKNISGTLQYGISGPWVHEILFGLVEHEGERKTFFQLEKTPWAPGLGNRIGHAIDAVDYFISGTNIGPYGKSQHTDKKPLSL
jgi:hypothetical protein